MPEETSPPVTSPLSHHHHTDVSSLDADSYTAHRLHHATPAHLHITTRRCFIGPIPEGWLKSQRREWYRHHLRLNYSSRPATFSADANVARHRRLTGLEGPSTTAVYGQSFPQPDDVVPEEEEREQRGGSVGLGAGSSRDGETAETAGETATLRSPPAVPIPRSSIQERTEGDGRDILAETQGDGNDGPGLVEEGPKAIPREQSPRGRRPSQARFKARPKKLRRSSTGSFITAREVSLVEPESIEEQERRENPTGLGIPKHNGVERVISQERQRPSITSSAQSGGTTADPETTNSLSSLIAHDSSQPSSQQQDEPRQDSPVKHLFDRVTGPSRRLPPTSSSEQTVGEPSGTTAGPATNGTAPAKRERGAAVHFNVPEESTRADLQARARVAQLSLRRVSRSALGRSVTDGRVIKMEKMLVRVDTTAGTLPNDYDENDSQKTVSRTVEKWREYMVACRESKDHDATFRLQLYTSRVIPVIEASGSKRSKHEIRLNRQTAKVNLYSSLDKTIVVWTPHKKGNIIYHLQMQAASSLMEWYTFLQNILGWHRARQLQVNVPGLNVSVLLDNPFSDLEASRDLAQAAEGDDHALLRTMKEEQAVAGKIVDRCITQLLKSNEYADVVATWNRTEKMGLAWKRYDRLEWVHGTNERKMYGTIAMQKSHELELRPKQHYPTTVNTGGHGQRLSRLLESEKHMMTEPPPIEGFLIRLTSQRGQDRRLGKMFYKRLYFSTHDHYLVFLRPARAAPPPPSTLPATRDARVPTASQIAQHIPLVYAVNPFPVEHGSVTWLHRSGDTFELDRAQRHDRDAFDEAERTVNNLLHCDGYIDLTEVARVRKMRKGAVIVDEVLEDGSDADFNADVPDSVEDDGATREPDEERTFELVMKNGLVVRLQAYDSLTKKEWMSRLRQLVRYWTHRHAADMQLLKDIRRRNLEALRIDEDAEAEVGQFAKKWEVLQSHASPELYHLCGVGCCRAIHLSGPLFHKPRRHATFTATHVLLVHGQLLLFRRTLRARSGRAVPATHADRMSALHLKDCYLYAGLLTESDLLYTNRTFDSNRPGRTALPRMYREDGWTSSDEDVMTCFVVWHGRKRSLFRSSTSSASTDPTSHDNSDGGEVEHGEKGGRRSRLKLVSSLGVPGRSIVFKARSRAERDHWVMAISMEIERLQRAADVRVTGSEA